MIVYAESGVSFYKAVQDLQQSLNNSKEYLDLVFNDISVRVSKNSNIDDLSTIYNLKHAINRLKLGYKD